VWLLGLLFIILSFSAITVLPKWVAVILVVTVSLLVPAYLENITDLFNAMRSIV